MMWTKMPHHHTPSFSFSFWFNHKLLFFHNMAWQKYMLWNWFIYVCIYLFVWIFLRKNNWHRLPPPNVHDTSMYNTQCIHLCIHPSRFEPNKSWRSHQGLNHQIISIFRYKNKNKNLLWSTWNYLGNSNLNLCFLFSNFIQMLQMKTWFWNLFKKEIIIIIIIHK